MHATEVMTGEKCALVCGFGDVSNSSTFALRDSGGRVFIADCDTICALQVGVEMFQAGAIESVVPEMDRPVSSTGSPSFRCSCVRRRMRPLSVPVSVHGGLPGGSQRRVDRGVNESRQHQAEKNDVHLLLEELDEKVANFHIPAFGAALIVLNSGTRRYIQVSRLKALSRIWAAPLATRPS